MAPRQSRNPRTIPWIGAMPHGQARSGPTGTTTLPCAPAVPLEMLPDPDEVISQSPPKPMQQRNG
jgi:hypothetical protein